MQNKLAAILSFWLIFGTVTLAQNLSVRTEFGFGTFRMEDLKDFQAAVLPDLGVNVESLSTFPPYYGYGTQIVSYFKSGIGLGITADFFSTGATNYYEDYSGSYELSMLTHAYNLGTVFSIKHIKRNHLNCFIEIGGGMKISSLKLTEHVVIQDPVVSGTYNFEGTSWYLKPIYRCEYKIFNSLSAGAFLGAELDFKSKLHLEEQKEAILRNADKAVRIDWTGLRTGLYLSINISYLKKQPQLAG